MAMTDEVLDFSICQANVGCEQIIMEAYQDERDKGLFTFYLEQAQLEDQLQSQRLQHKKDKKNHLQNSLNKSLHQHHKEHQQQPVKQTKIYTSHRQDHMPISSKDQGNLQHRKKLLDILQRQKYRNIKMHNLKVILKQSTPTNAQIKQQLYDTFSNRNSLNQMKTNQVFRDRQESKNNPFQKLALCPTNFDTEFEQAPKIEKKHVHHLRVRSGDVNYDAIRKTEKGSSFEKEEQKEKQINNIFKRNFLPRLDLRVSEQVSTELPQHPTYQRVLLHSYKSKHLQRPHPKIHSQRYKKDTSLNIQPSSFHSASVAKSKRGEQRSFAVFRDSIASGKEQEKVVQQNKEKMYVELIRQLKFK